MQRLSMSLGVGLLALLWACSQSKGPPGVVASESAFIRIQGAGASFPAPLYFRWFKTFNERHSNVRIDYQSVGSGSGVKAIIDGTVDFAASDAAMRPEEMARVARGVQLLPMTAGSIVLTYNLDGVDELRLTRAAYVDIFLGKIRNWNDPRIAVTNPHAVLPTSPINVVVRADSSGTSYVFTKHLSAVSSAFASSPGTNKMPSWPVGTGARGNEGVTASIKTTPGAIGYIEYGYAHSQGLPMALLENRAGSFVRATAASGQAALSSADFSPDMIAWVPDPKGRDAYSIVTYSWLILYRSYDDPRKLAALKDVVRYAVDEGQAMSETLGYIPLPKAVRDRVRAALGRVTAKTGS